MDESLDTVAPVDRTGAPWNWYVSNYRDDEGDGLPGITPAVFDVFAPEDLEDANLGSAGLR